MRYFDYERIAREAGIPEEKLEEWRNVYLRQYLGDEMMTELRLLRTCMAARRSPEDLQAIMTELEAENQKP